MKLVLWDIDGTILCAGKAGEKAFDLAFRSCFGVEGTIGVLNYHGRTDVFIANHLLNHYGIPATLKNVHRLVEAYVENLREQLPQAPLAKTHPGVLGLIEELHQRRDVAQGLLTGNIQQGARAKLEHFNLWHYFEFGAFADDSQHRNDLGPFALARAKDKHGREFAPSEVYIVGDTPFDIECARVIGAHCIAVATGTFSMEQLREGNPLVVLPDLENRLTLMQALGLVDRS
jgi:phosphoglycolate phosphatase